jgi:hypothetical protein
MGLLTFNINVTLDGCVDHREGIADDETHAFFTRLMDEAEAMLWGRVTYEMMESYWPAVARGDEEAPPAMREWAVKHSRQPVAGSRGLAEPPSTGRGSWGGSVWDSNSRHSDQVNEIAAVTSYSRPVFPPTAKMEPPKSNAATRCDGES